MQSKLVLLGFVLFSMQPIQVRSESLIPIWSKSVLPRTAENIGRELPQRANEEPPAIRMTNIESPSIKHFPAPAEKAHGTAVLIIPGGGYNYAVVGKEGAEIARWLNNLGISAFVLYYRTPTRKLKDDWLAPAQDAQQAIRLIRSNAEQWNIDSNKIGMIGFSAGGNAAAIAATNSDVPSLDESLNTFSARPDFLMLLYPWKLVNSEEKGLREEVKVNGETPPTLLIHTHDDGVTSLSSIEFYKAMKRHKRPAELHIYPSGGHGYGLRKVEGSMIHTWPQRSEDWMQRRGILSAPE